MESKKHKQQAYKLLKSLAFWMETDKNDYDIKDLDKVLEEVKTHYKNYLFSKEDDNFVPDIQNKSYK